jgi:hypothetical protein
VFYILIKVKYNCQRNEGLLNLRRIKVSRRKTPTVMIAGFLISIFILPVIDLPG